MDSGKNRKNILTINDENRIQFVIGLTIYGLFFRNATYMLTLIPMSIKNILGVSIKMAILISLLIALSPILRKMSQKHYIGSALIFVAIGMHMILLPQNNIYIKDTLETFIMTILPVLLCFTIIKDYGLLFKTLYRSSIIITICNIPFFLLFVRGNIGNWYSMGYGDSLLLPSILFSYILLERSLQNIVCFNKCIVLMALGVNMLSILLFGSRGPFVGIIIFLGVMICHRSSSKIRRIMIGFFVIILAIILMVLRQEIMQGLVSLVERFGLYSRTLVSLSQAKVGDSGRVKIWVQIIDEFKKSPLNFRGINGDIVITGTNYSHNIFLELVVTFGLILGGIFSIIFTVMVVKNILCHDSLENEIALVLLFCFFPICLWSGSFWTSMYFWLWMVTYEKGRKVRRA